MTDTNNKSFTECLSIASQNMQIGEVQSSYSIILEAMSIAPSAPEPHNLLGIWFDINGREDLARKHFRAAYSLDPSYKPACRNLEQLCEIFRDKEKIKYDFGDK